MLRSVRVLAIAVVGVVYAAACGPIAYTSQVTFGADGAVDRARAADAEKYSPYWYTRAVQYLHMAREVAGRADFQGADKFGRLSEQAAQKATDEANAKREAGEPPWSSPAAPAAAAPAKSTIAPAKASGGVAPAKDPGGIAPAKDDSP